MHGDAQFAQRSGDQVRFERRHEFELPGLDLLDRVIRTGQNLAVGVQQFNDRVQRQLRAVDVDPDLRPGGAPEAVDVHVIGRVEESMNLEAHAEVFVAALLVGRQISQHLGCRRGRVGPGGRGLQRLHLHHDVDVAIVAELVQTHAAPVIGPGNGGNAVVVGVGLRRIVGLETSSNGVVIQRSQHHGEAGLTENVQRATDAVLDFKPPTGDGEARPVVQVAVGDLTVVHQIDTVVQATRSQQLDHETLDRAALEPQASVMMVLGNHDLVERPLAARVARVLLIELIGQDVGDVRVVPDALRRQFLAHESPSH